jgi:hexokinase
MNPTWCMGMPDGNEQGRYLALDMGGTNLRVCEITLTEKKSEFDIIQSKYRMPEELKTGEADELWEYIADCLQQFIQTHHGEENLETLPHTRQHKTILTTVSSSAGLKVLTSME